jgi:hypothetical protein
MDAGKDGSRSDGKRKGGLSVRRISLKGLRFLDSRRTPPAVASGRNAPSASRPLYSRRMPFPCFCIASV